MRTARAIYHFFRRRPISTFGLVLLLIVSALVEGVGIGFMIPLLESIDTTSDLESASRVSRYLSEVYGRLGIPFVLWTIMVGGFLLFASRAFLTYIGETWMVHLANLFGAEARIDAFSGLLNADLGYINRRKGSDSVNTIVVEASRFQGAFLNSVRLLTGFAEAAIYLALALYLSWQLVLAAMGLIGVIFLVVRHEFGRASTHGDSLSKANRAVQGTAIEHLSGIRILRAFNLQGRSLETFKRQAFELLRVYYGVAKSRARLDASFRIGMLGGLLITVYIAVTFLELPVPVLLTFIFVLYRLYPQISAINKAFHQMMFSISGFDNVRTLIKETEDPSIRSGATPFSALSGDITLEGVSFGYDEQRPVVKDLSLSIKKGETTAIVGGSGAGKTTVVNLLMRFYDPSSGSILVDGIDLRELDLDAWRSTTGLVNQDIFLFNDTIANNIALAKQGATEKEIVEAAKRANADEFIQDLPDRYDTSIGDRGVRLSGGQRQRIALARAVVRDPQILILDEATSELDSRSETLIRQAVEELGADRTIITIAHRLSTIRNADKIVVLENGEVVEQGSHDELAGDNKQYAEFLRIQEMATSEGS